jgi:PAS domain S-box-containing protein
MKQPKDYETNRSSHLFQEQLDEANERIRLLSHRGHLAETMTDASIDRIIALDTDLTIIAWNKRNELITGIPKRAVLGKSYYEVFPETKKHQPTVKAIEQALNGLTVFLPADKSSPDEGYYENHFIPLKDAQEKVTGMMNIKHDVAHRIKAENELKALNKALARKNRELRQRNEELLSFTHVTSHDLKEPLRKIYTFIEMIATRENENLTDKGKNYFKRIQAAVQRMGMLTDDILTFAELNAEETELSDIDLEHMLLLVRQMLQEEIHATGAVITHSRLPAVRGYRQLISQLLYHLLANAIKFRKQDIQPAISISWEQVNGTLVKHAEALPDTEYIKLIVEDNGIGFDKAYKDKVFQMFQRLHGSGYPGTGIGLALCKKIAAIHQGFITAQSKEQRGSTFCVYLPL